MSNKQFLTLQEQISFLETKNIRVPQTSNNMRILRDSNYYNMISCSKVKFALGRELNGKYIYGESHFKAWVQYFKKDRNVSEHLMKNLLRFEQIINSRTAYYVSLLFENDEISDVEKASLRQAIKGYRNSTNYKGEETWVHISNKTFGELRYIIKWLWKSNYKAIVGEIFEGYDFYRNNFLRKLDETVSLRNNIFHFRPLNIYLIYGTEKTRQSHYGVRREVVEEIFFQRPIVKIKHEMIEILNETKRFNGIKKRPNSIGRNSNEFFPETAQRHLIEYR